MAGSARHRWAEAVGSGPHRRTGAAGSGRHRWAAAVGSGRHRRAATVEAVFARTRFGLQQENNKQDRTDNSKG